MLGTTALQAGNQKPKRGHDAAALSSRPESTRRLRLTVLDGSGTTLGRCQVEASGQASAMRVEISSEIEGEGETRHNGSCVLPSGESSNVNLTILPTMRHSCFELWSSGVLNDDDVLQRMGRAGLEAFRDRWIAEAAEQTMEVSPVTSDEEGEQA